MAPAAAAARGARTRSTTTTSTEAIKRLWGLIATGLYALLTLWRLTISKINGALLFLDYGLRRRTDFLHKVCVLC